MKKVILAALCFLFCIGLPCAAQTHHLHQPNAPLVAVYSKAPNRVASSI